jgi:hypothetical protein
MTLGFRKTMQRAAITALIGAALVVAAATSLVAANGTHSQSTSKTSTLHGSAIKGISVGTVNVSHLAVGKAVSGQSLPLLTPKTAAQQAAYQRYMLAHPSLLPAARGVAAPSSSASFVGPSKIPLVYKSANGLSSVDSGCGCTPPDQATGINNLYMLEGVNNVFQINNINLAKVAGPFQASTFFSGAAGFFFSDPQITYDAERAVWFITWLEVKNDESTDSIDIAVSTTGNPLGSYHVYKVGAPGGTIFDYDTLGYEYWDMWLTFPAFSGAAGHAFLGNYIVTLDINNMLSGAGAGGFIYSNLTVGVNGTPSPAFRLSPATEDGVPAAEYVNASDAGYGVTSTDMTTCAFTNTHFVATGVAPVASCVATAMAAAYDDPVNADQPGNPNTVEAGVGWKQIRYQGGHLYFAMPILINCSGTVEDGLLWQEDTPRLNTASPQAITGVDNYQAGYWCFNGHVDSYMPTAYPDSEGDIALVYNLSSNVSSIFPSIGFTGRQEADALGLMGQGGNNAAIVVGTATNLTTRFGDYSACALQINSVARGIVYCSGEWGSSNGWNTWNYALRMQ